MRKKLLVIWLAISMVLVAMSTGVALAQDWNYNNPNKNDVNNNEELDDTSDKVKISASNAISIAEDRVEGTATGLILVNEDDQPAYLVKIKDQVVRVDANTGNILSVKSLDEIKSEMKNHSSQRSVSNA